MSDTDAPVCERKTKRKRERFLSPEDDDCVHTCVGVAVEIYRSAVSGGACCSCERAGWGGWRNRLR